MQMLGTEGQINIGGMVLEYRFFGPPPAHSLTYVFLLSDLSDRHPMGFLIPNLTYLISSLTA